QLEQQARTLRHAGDYSQAARLYLKAAALHRRAADSGAAEQNRPLGDARNQAAPAEKGVGTTDPRAVASSLAAAAWDVTHAIECLAAGGQIDEARSIYDQQLVPGYTSVPQAIVAAQRA